MLESAVRVWKSFCIFVELTHSGFYFSKNTHLDSNPDKKKRDHWGFYRFNHILYDISIFDIDFDVSKERSYWHIHGDNVRIKLTYDEKQTR